MNQTKQSEADFQTVRRFMIVRMNRAKLEPLFIARNLTLIHRNFTPEQLQATAEAIKSKQHADHDLIHDIMGIARRETCFVPRIHEIAEVTE